jgi:uncharacterized membrane protein (TIGR02234 family)
MPDPDGRPASGRRTFGPTVLLGLASAALAAVASAKPWVGSGATTGSTTGAGDATMTALDAGTRYPLASAVSLVLLASWGVLLVTRGWVRRVFAVLAALAAVALVASVVAGYVTLPDSASDSYDELMGRGSGDTGFTGWFWTSAVCAVVSLVPAALAVRLVRQWPEMGSRYDAPGAPDSTVAQGASDPERELWHALDEGRDPTDTGRPAQD